MEIATKYLGKEEVAKMMTGDFSKFEALGKKFFNGEGRNLLKNVLDHFILHHLFWITILSMTEIVSSGNKAMRDNLD